MATTVSGGISFFGSGWGGGLLIRRRHSRNKLLPAVRGELVIADDGHDRIRWNLLLRFGLGGRGRLSPQSSAQGAHKSCKTQIHVEGFLVASITSGFRRTSVFARVR